MNRREFKVERSYTISIGDLIFQIRNNGLFVAKDNEKTLYTPVTVEEMTTLSEFCIKAIDILQPIPGSKLLYINNSGPQSISIFVDEKNDYSLLINDQLQFTTESEEIYHEALVGPAVCSLHYSPQKFLILGGGDGLVAKQIFKENPEAEVLLVDFDKSITDLFTYDETLIYFNEESMKRCQVLNEDAFEFVKSHTTQYDVIICDFPDPDHDIFNKLYSSEFYSNVKKLLKSEGIMAVQSGSLVTKVDEVPDPKLNRSCRQYKTISQEFFDKAMKTFRPDVYSSEDVQINTVENYKALEYRINEVYYNKGKK